MFELTEYLKRFISVMQSCFGERLLYIGLQGSQLRGEATKNSDIDIMVILDEITPEALDLYRDALHSVGYAERACGFICAKQDMLSWNALECCQLLHTTKDIYGRLSDYLPAWSMQDECEYIRLSVGNLYHELCHRYIHRGRDRSKEKLPGTGKSVFFILQNLHYVKTGEFVQNKAQLQQVLDGLDLDVFKLSHSIAEQPDYDFDHAYALLLKWCQDVLRRMQRSSAD